MRLPFGEPIDIEAVRIDAKNGVPYGKLALAFVTQKGLRLSASEVAILVTGDDAIERFIAANYSMSPE